MSENFFAYGTLMFPEIAMAVANLSEKPAAAALHDYARYAVHNRDRAQVPAIVPEVGGMVRGKLYRNLSDQAWQPLDHFEEVDQGLYIRQPVVVVLDGGIPENANTYIAGAKIRGLLHSSWDSSDFQREHLSYYVEKLLPGFLSGVR